MTDTKGIECTAFAGRRVLVAEAGEADDTSVVDLRAERTFPLLLT
jgi:hypothetical protein